MTLSTVVLGVAVVAAIITALVYMFRDNRNIYYNSLPMSFLQNFVGVLFLFSGGVKAVDPLGTAYKLEQYFAEFEVAFGDTWLSFIKGIFPFFATYAVTLSVIVIIFEIVLGLMVLLGHSKKFTTWAFLLLILFFTFLTGYTYLTGYVPTDATFFQFGKWGPYVETNMRVTDCGCFGDFLKLEPKVSFLKDVFLLIPGVLFILFNGRLHQIFKARTRSMIVGAETIFLLIFCYYSFGINLPLADFRPFKNGADVKATKKIEMDAAANVEVIAYTIKNTKTGKIAEIDARSYLTDIENYSEADGWDRSTVEQIKTKPAIESTKISEFSIQGEMGKTYVDFILPSVTSDTLFGYLASELVESFGDTTGIQIVNSYTEVNEGDIESELMADPNYSFMIVSYSLEKASKSAYKNKINALHAGAEGDGLNFYAVTSSVDEFVEEFRHDVQSPYVFHSADDILLKTIIRSNPGIVLWKDGKIIKKWHHKQVPSYEKIKAEYMK